MQGKWTGFAAQDRELSAARRKGIIFKIGS
jgi:hypothetical protein